MVHVEQRREEIREFTSVSHTHEARVGEIASENLRRRLAYVVPATFANLTKPDQTTLPLLRFLSLARHACPTWIASILDARPTTIVSGDPPAHRATIPTRQTTVFFILTASPVSAREWIAVGERANQNESSKRPGPRFRAFDFEDVGLSCSSRSENRQQSRIQPRILRFRKPGLNSSRVPEEHRSTGRWKRIGARREISPATRRRRVAVERVSVNREESLSAERSVSRHSFAGSSVETTSDSRKNRDSRERTLSFLKTVQRCARPPRARYL